MVEYEMTFEEFCDRRAEAYANKEEALAVFEAMVEAQKPDGYRDISIETDIDLTFGDIDEVMDEDEDYAKEDLKEAEAKGK